MGGTPDLTGIMAAKCPDELLDVLANPDNYLPGAPTAAVKELGQRKLSAEHKEILQAILKNRENRSQALCPHCLRPSPFESSPLCNQCGLDRNVVRFSCSKCSATLDATALSAGGHQPCPVCKTAVLVPSESEERLLIESEGTEGLHRATLERLRAALRQTGEEDEAWRLTLVDLANLPPEKLVDHLRNRHVEVTIARAAARAIRAFRPSLKNSNNAINKNIAIGIVLIGVGIFMTLMTYSAATRSGGTYWVFYGAMATGLLQILLGLEQNRRRSPSIPTEASQTHFGPKCVSCEAPIPTGVKTCAQCGWTQPG